MGVAGCYRYGWPDHPGIRTGLAAVANVRRDFATVYAAIASGRFVRDPVITLLEFAAACLNGRLFRFTEAQVFGAPPRGNFCERLRRTGDGPAEGACRIAATRGQSCALEPAIRDCSSNPRANSG